MDALPLTFPCNGFADDTTDGFVQAQHIEEYATDLRKVETTNGRACRDICFEDVGQNFDIVQVAQYIYVLCSLGHEGIPLKW